MNYADFNVSKATPMNIPLSETTKISSSRSSTSGSEFSSNNTSETINTTSEMETDNTKMNSADATPRLTPDSRKIMRLPNLFTPKRPPPKLPSRSFCKISKSPNSESQATDIDTSDESSRLEWTISRLDPAYFPSSKTSTPQEPTSSKLSEEVEEILFSLKSLLTSSSSNLDYRGSFQALSNITETLSTKFSDFRNCASKSNREKDQAITHSKCLQTYNTDLKAELVSKSKVINDLNKIISQGRSKSFSMKLKLERQAMKIENLEKEIDSVSGHLSEERLRNAFLAKSLESNNKLKVEQLLQYRSEIEEALHNELTTSFHNHATEISSQISQLLEGWGRGLPNRIYDPISLNDEPSAFAFGNSYVQDVLSSLHSVNFATISNEIGTSISAMKKGLQKLESVIEESLRYSKGLTTVQPITKLQVLQNSSRSLEQNLNSFEDEPVDEITKQNIQDKLKVPLDRVQLLEHVLKSKDLEISKLKQEISVIQRRPNQDFTNQESRDASSKLVKEVGLYKKANAELLTLLQHNQSELHDLKGQTGQEKQKDKCNKYDRTQDLQKLNIDIKFLIRELDDERRVVQKANEDCSLVKNKLTYTEKLLEQTNARLLSQDTVYKQEISKLRRIIDSNEIYLHDYLKPNKRKGTEMQYESGSEPIGMIVTNN